MDERQAIQAIRQGDLTGLEFIVRTYQVKALRAAILVTRQRTLAEDIVQDSFLRLVRTVHSFDERRPFEPWFMRIVINAAVKAAQRASRRSFGSAGWEDDDFEKLLERYSPLADAAADQPEKAAEIFALQQGIQAALAQLSPRQRAVIVGRYFLELDEKELAAELSISPGTVKWLLHAARQRLRALLGERSAW